ncbi:MAG: adenosylcobinamide-GDP ribazoletransferase [Elusimicrobiota bacterium]
MSTITTFVLIIVSGFVTIGSTKFVTKKLGGMTGDSIGAINEVIEITVLLVFLIFNL